MGQYTQGAQEINDAVGGSAVTNCITRLAHLGAKARPQETLEEIEGLPATVS